MNKIDVLREIFELENIETKIKECPRITLEQLLNTLAKPSYNLSKEFGLTSRIVSRYLSLLFPDKPKTNSKVDNWLLSKYLYKECKNCLNTKTVEEFHKNSSTSDGINAYCKICQNNLTGVTSAVRQSKYKAAKLERIPAYVDCQELEAISKFYSKCPRGYHVDHIVPLQGTLVSGLHCLSNLQYLPAQENISKSNKFTPH